MLIKDHKSYSRVKIEFNSYILDLRNTEKICTASKKPFSFRYLHLFIVNRVLISSGLMGKPEFNYKINLKMNVLGVMC